MHPSTDRARARLRPPRRRPPERAVELAVLALLGSVPALAAAPPDPAALGDAVERAATAGFTGSVLVVHGGEVVLERGVGTAQPEAGIPVTPETVFDVGSVSKELTLALIWDLAARGELRLDQPIGELLPGVPADKLAITVQQVIDHRAGLAEYVDREGESGDFTPLTGEQALERILGDPLRFAPGSDQAYSNAGYTLLALIVERVTGKTFPAALRETILQPAGMTSTGFYGHGWEAGRVAHGRGEARFGAVNSPAAWPPPAWALLGNGGLVTTAGDLARWHRAVVAGQVLAPAARERLLERLRPEATSLIAGANDFGFCTFVARLPGDTQVYVLGSSGIDRSRELARELVRAAGGELRLPPRAAGAASEADGPPFPDSPTGRRLREIYRALSPQTDLEAFFEASFAPALRTGHPLEAHLAIWGELRALLGPRPEVGSLRRTGPASAQMVLRSSEGATVRFDVEVESDEPHRIVSISVE